MALRNFTLPDNAMNAASVLARAGGTVIVDDFQLELIAIPQWLPGGAFVHTNPPNIKVMQGHRNPLGHSWNAPRGGADPGR